MNATEKLLALSVLALGGASILANLAGWPIVAAILAAPAYWLAWLGRDRGDQDGPIVEGVLADGE